MNDIVARLALALGFGVIARAGLVKLADSELFLYPAAGLAVSMAFRHPRRSAGMLIPVCAVGLTASLLDLPGVLVASALCGVGILRNGVARNRLQAALVGIAAAAVLLPYSPPNPVPVAAFALAGSIVQFWLHLVELTLAVTLRPFFDIRLRGPGADLLPGDGPLLVVCNHTAYFDPFWLGKVFPRRLRAMMTSFFYDKPLIRPLMLYVAGAIRVEATGFRREAPELDEAVRLLEQGDAVLIFPEAILRRKEEPLLRRFGQGAWVILSRLPTTRVVCVWIEGGWGSAASYKDGPPFKGKKMDVNRRIDVSVSEPEAIPPEILADRNATREYLMRRVLEQRRHLGLEVPVDAGADEAGAGAIE